MNKGPGQTPAPPLAPPRTRTDDDNRVLRLERDALRIDPPAVRFSALRSA
jgi:hypothetical protein